MGFHKGYSRVCGLVFTCRKTLQPAVHFMPYHTISYHMSRNVILLMPELLHRPEEAASPKGSLILVRGRCVLRSPL